MCLLKSKATQIIYLGDHDIEINKISNRSINRLSLCTLCGTHKIKFFKVASQNVTRFCLHYRLGYTGSL